MLDHFRGINDVKTRAAAGQCLGSAALIINIQPILAGMQGGGCDRRLGYISAGHAATKSRHRFGKQTATTSNIQNAQPG